MKINVLARRITACMVCSLLAVSMAWAAQVSPEEAAVVANRFMNPASAASTVRKAPAKRMVRNAADAQQANRFYIYENESGEGWVIIAADDRIRPVLAYSTTGHFDLTNMPENLRYWLSEYNRQIDFVTESTDTPDADVQQRWDRLRKGYATVGTPVVQPLIETTWNQMAPYYNMCPQDGLARCLTGCVATCMAQVMNFWKWPETGTGSHTDSLNGFNCYADFGATTYDWDNMLPYYSGNNDPKVNRDAVATLMYHCGVAVDMSYGTEASGAQTISYDGILEYCAETALTRFFGYEPESVKGYARDGGLGMKGWTKPEWIAMLKSELDAHRPIMYAGRNNDSGHSFVCDGYDDADFFHFNWGWGGSHDGYFEVDALNPGAGGAGSGSGTYNSGQDVIVGIQPLNSAHAIVTYVAGCRIILSAGKAENNKELSATIIPTDSTYDMSSLSIKLGSVTLTPGTDYTLSEDNKSLVINASAITGDNSNKLIINVEWVKNRYTYSVYGNRCAEEEIHGMVPIDSALQLVVLPADGYSLDNANNWIVLSNKTQLVYGTDYTYDAATSILTIPTLTDSVQIFAFGGKPIVWMLNEDEFARTFTLLDLYVMPASKPAACTDGRVFTGWCPIAGYESEDTAPEYIERGGAYTADTLYAVFANEETHGGTPFDPTQSGGQFLIAAKVGNTKYYAIGKPENGVIESSTDESDAAVYTFDKLSGGFSIKLGNDYITYDKSEYSHLVVSDEPFTWAISKSTAGAGTWRLKSVTGRGWTFHAGTDNNFACYSTSAVKPGTGYYDLEIEVGGNKTYTDFTTECTSTQGFDDADCGCEPAAVKMLRDGQIVIVRGDAVYTIMGNRL